jgi:hypothetical protein
VIALTVLGISAAFKPESLPKIPLCTFKQITGRPCPGCGMTRAFCSISHARFSEAFHFNPFSYFFYAAAVLLVLWPLLAWKFPRLKTWARETTLFIYLAPGVIICMTIFGVVRMFMGSDV